MNADHTTSGALIAANDPDARALITGVTAGAARVRPEPPVRALSRPGG